MDEIHVVERYAKQDYILGLFVAPNIEQVWHGNNCCENTALMAISAFRLDYYENNSKAIHGHTKTQPFFVC